MIYSIKNILVAIDFSDSSLNALKIAVEIAKRQEAKLYLINIIKLGNTMTLGNTSDDYQNESIEMMNTSQKHLFDYSDQIFSKHGVISNSICEIGNLVTIINEKSIELEIDLVVIGTHGSSGWKNFFVGSDAINIIKHSICPVLAIPQNHTKLVFEEILYPVRLVEGVSQKYDYVKPIIEKNKSNIHLLGVAKDTEFDEMNEELTKISTLLFYKNENVTCEKIATDDIAQSVLDTATLRKSDLLVINATLDITWNKLFSGSYTQQIINHCKLPVLCIKPSITTAEIPFEYHYMLAESVYPNPSFII